MSHNTWSVISALTKVFTQRGRGGNAKLAVDIHFNNIFQNAPELESLCTGSSLFFL